MTDNGPGISTATVADICNFDMLVSDKARYRGPTRGAQGNAFKTLLGIPYALGVTEPVVIESRRVRHELRVTVDRVGSVGVDHDETVSDRTLGTSVTVPVPAHLEVDAGRWAYGAALVNPHATISVIDHGQSGDTDEVEDEIFTNPQVRSGRSGRRRNRRLRTGTTLTRSRGWRTPISTRPSARVLTCRSGNSSASSMV